LIRVANDDILLRKSRLYMNFSAGWSKKRHYWNHS